MEEQLHLWNWEQQVRGAVHITADQKVEKKRQEVGARYALHRPTLSNPF